MNAIYVLEARVKHKIKKKKGKTFVLFANVKRAIDKVKREELEKKIEEKRVDKNLRVRIEKLYEETKNMIVVNSRTVGRFRTKKGVRQVCPLSVVFFNILFRDLKEEMKQRKVG